MRRRTLIGAVASGACALLAAAGASVAAHSPAPHKTEIIRTGVAVGERGVVARGAPSATDLRRVRGEDDNDEFDRPGAGEPPDAKEDAVRHRSAPTSAAEPVRPRARTRSTSDEFTIFRSAQTNTGGSSTAEPTTANDGASLLATTNWAAAVSTDNGLSWATLNPFANPVSGGFCCDQVAYPVDRGGHALVLWLLQYKYLATEQQNALGLRVFRAPTDLPDNAPSCQWEFRPQENFKLQKGYWFDYNRVSSTDRYVYITTNVKDADKDDKRVGALIFRLAISDLDDGDCHVSYRSWYEDGDPYISPVQNAGTTMYLGRLVQKVGVGDEMEIYSIADSSNTLEHVTRDVENFPSRDKDRDCPGPDGTDPCDRLHPDQATGFRSGNSIGWLWTAPQGDGFPFPNVRVAVFDTSTLKKVAEEEIHNDGYAWALPAAGVNARGDVGVILYAMGGGSFPFPSAQAFVVENPRDWSGLTMHRIVTSTSGAPTWGDYASVRAYGNCPNTFLGSAWSMQGGRAQTLSVWFGDAADGCPDLGVSALAVFPAIAAPGVDISLVQTTRNTGSASAPATSTRYYLSRDADRSPDDLLLPPATEVPSVPRNGSTAGEAVKTPVPANATGSYYPLACADDRSAVAEVSDANNCFAGSQVVVVTSPAVSGIAPASSGTLITAGATLKTNLSVQFGGSSAAQTVSFYLSPSASLGSGTVSLGSAVVKPAAPRPTIELQLPGLLPAGPLHLAACIGTAPTLSKCLLAQGRLYAAR